MWLGAMLMVCSFQTIAQDIGPYSEVRIHLSNEYELQRLVQGGWHPDHLKRSKEYVEAVVSADELRLIRSLGASVSVLTEDLEAAFESRPKLSSLEWRSMEQRLRSQYGILGFGFGSMGGFYTYDEVIRQLDTMALLHPNLISVRDSIGSSIQGRAIWAVRISDNPGVNENEPEVLYTGLHHAREPEGMMAVIYFMYYLLENYGTDPEATYLVNNREMYFVPVVNPDGYVYNQQTNPNGGGFWRKNRRANVGGTYGVDLNRNYGYMWAYDDEGSSGSPGAEDYRGTAPFSEPETAAIRDFCQAHDFRLALNYHTYGDLLIYPWGYIASFQTPDSAVFDAFTTDMTQYNGYSHGTGDQTVGYVTNGDSDDWMYGEQTTKDKILSMTPEVGPSFWPGIDLIFPLAAENLYPNLFLAWAAGSNPKFLSGEMTGLQSAYVNPGDTGIVVVEYLNKGISASTSTLDLSLLCDDPAVTILTSSSQIGTMDSLETADNEASPFVLMVDSSASNGHRVWLAVLSSFDGVGRTDSFEVIVGTPTVLFEDSAENTAGWSTGQGWGTHGDRHAGDFSLTDSPLGLYGNNANNPLTMIASFDLSTMTTTMLEFWTKWNIESDWDFATVQISTNSGVSWINLRGVHAQRASGNPGPQSNTNHYGYDGTQLQFMKETVDLTTFAGMSNLKLRFNLASDNSVRADGWYVDDIRILGYAPGITSVADPWTTPTRAVLSQNVPNPFNPSTVISYQLPVNTHTALTVYNLLGQEVRALVRGYKEAGSYRVMWDGRDNSGNVVASGVYFYRMVAGDFVQSRRMLLIK
jgi:murein tripeptide amidase MpaA